MRLSYWNSGKKSNNYKYIDRVISQYFGVGGTAVYVHLYQGPYEQEQPGYTPGDDTGSDNQPQPLGIQSVEDVLFLENRDRKYSDSIYELRGIYNVSDLDFDAKQFGLFFNNDVLFIEFHLNDMIALCGRRLIPGDVLELPHQRDDTRPNNLPAINKYYVVKEATRAADGYSITWYPHIWRCKMEPMSASQEFEDILQTKATNPLGFVTPNTLADILSTAGNDLGINEAVYANASANVPKRFFETRQYYLMCEGVDPVIPWIFTGGGDGIPPNGLPLSMGFQFPSNPTIGDYFLRNDYSPAALFKWTGTRWCMQEVNWRGTEWSAATRLLASFINDDRSETYPDGLTMPVKQNMSKVVTPRAGFMSWQDSVNENCSTMDYVDCTIDFVEYMNVQDQVDANYIATIDPMEIGAALDIVIGNYETIVGITETGNMIDTADGFIGSAIVEYCRAVDAVNGNGIFEIIINETMDAEDQTFIFPGFPIVEIKPGYSAGANYYSLDGLDVVDTINIEVNQEVDPNDYPTNQVTVNNNLPNLVIPGVMINMTDEMGNIFVSETGIPFILEDTPGYSVDNVLAEPPTDEAGGGIIVINI